MPKYLSGRVRKSTNAELKSDRYQYLSLEQAEPNPSDPQTLGIVDGASSTDFPIGTKYQVFSVYGDPNPGNRYWQPVGGGLQAGSISVYDEGSIVGGSKSIIDLNFVGGAVVAESTPPGTGTAATITVAPPGHSGELLFNLKVGTGITDFATSDNLVFDSDVGILTSKTHLHVGLGGSIFSAFSGTSETVGVASVGIGTSDPTATLHVKGDIRLEGTIYDGDNDGGTAGDLIVKANDGTLEWKEPKTVQSGAGGYISNVQYHDDTGLVDGASNFVWVEPTTVGMAGSVGIGSTQPRVLLDVVGIASFSEIQVSGFSTFTDDVFVGTGATVGFGTSAFFLDHAGIYFGDSNDLKIHHSASGAGSTSYIQHTGAGNLNISANTGDTIEISASIFHVTNSLAGDQNEYLIEGKENDYVKLYYNSNEKLATTNTGVNVTGILTGSQTLNSPELYINPTGVGTIGNIKISGNKIDTTVGSLILDSNSGTVATPDKFTITNSTDSTNVNSGALQVDGGVGINKNVFVGTGLSVSGYSVYTSVSDPNTPTPVTYPYVFTTDSDPAGGEVYFNQSNEQTATLLTIDERDANDVNRGNLVLRHLRLGDTVTIVQTSDSTNRVVFKVTGDTTEHSGFGATSWDVPISYLEGDWTSVSDETQVNVTVLRRGEGSVILASAGGITTTGGDLYVKGDLYTNQDIVSDEGLFQKLLINPGVATFRGDIHVGLGNTAAFFDVDNGRVGIGTSVPSDELHLFNQHGDVTLKLESYEANKDTQIKLFHRDVAKWTISNDSSNTHQLEIMGDGGDSDKFLIIKQDGTIGIGEDNPSYLLDIKGATGGNATFQLRNDGVEGTDHTVIRNKIDGVAASNYIYFGDSQDDDIGIIEYDHGDDSLKFTTNTTQVLTIDSSGAINIGGNAAASRLNVVGSNAPQSGSANPGTITDALAMFYGGKRTTIATNNHIDSAILHIKGQITDVDDNTDGTWTTGQIVFSGRRATGAQAIIENNTVFNYDNQTAGAELRIYTAPVSQHGATAAVERLRIESDGDVIIGNGTHGAAGTFSVGANGSFRSVLATGTAQDTLLGAIHGVSNGFQVNTDASDNQTYTFHNGSTVALEINSSGTSTFKKDISLEAGLKDKDGELGTTGQLLESTGTKTNWVSPSDLTIENANKVGVGTTDADDTTVSYYPTFVDSNNNDPDNRLNECLYSDIGLSYSLSYKDGIGIGSVGIGTSNPDTILHVEEDYGSAIFKLEGHSNGDAIVNLRAQGTGIGKIAAWDQLAIGKADATNDIASDGEWMRITETGQVLVGIDNAVNSDVNFQLHSATSGTGPILNMTNDTGDCRIFFGPDDNTNSANAAGQIRYSVSKNNLSAYTSNTERLKIDANGNFIISAATGISTFVGGLNATGIGVSIGSGGLNVATGIATFHDGIETVSIASTQGYCVAGGFNQADNNSTNSHVDYWKPNSIPRGNYIPTNGELIYFTLSHPNIVDGVPRTFIFEYVSDDATPDTGKCTIVNPTNSIYEYDQMSTTQGIWRFNYTAFGGYSDATDGFKTNGFDVFASVDSIGDDNFKIEVGTSPLIINSQVVGIGTSVPIDSQTTDRGALLAVAGSVKAVEFYGTLKGSIDPDIAIDKADKLKLTNVEAGSNTNYIWFGAGDTVDTYDSLKINKNGLVYKDSKFGLGTNAPDKKLDIVEASSAVDLRLKTSGNSFNSFIFDSARAKDTQFAIIDGRWNDKEVARIQFVTGSDDTNYDDGYMAFHTRKSGEELKPRQTITSEGHVGIGTTQPTEPARVLNEKILSVGIVTANKLYGSINGVNLLRYSSGFTASAGVAVGIDTFVKDSYDSAEYTLHFKLGTDIQSQKLLVMDNGSVAYSNEYALMYHEKQLVDVSCTVSGSNIIVNATPVSGISGALTYVWQRNILTL